MYCPSCGQIQPAADTKFCTRCGFLLAAVTQLLTSGGQLMLPMVQQAGGSTLSPRQRGQRMGAMMMLLTILLVPVVAIVTGVLHIMPALLVPLTAVGLFIGGLLRIVYASMFEDSGRTLAGPPGPAAPPYIPAYMAPKAVAPPVTPEAFPSFGQVSDWQKPRNTAELINPPSVTENTTRLLDKTPEAN